MGNQLRLFCTPAAAILYKGTIVNFYARFFKLKEEIFEQLDDESLVNCRVVNKIWLEIRVIFDPCPW